MGILGRKILAVDSSMRELSTDGIVGANLMRVKRNGISRAALGALAFACVVACASPSSAQSDSVGKNNGEEEFFNSGNDKFASKDYLGAIADYTKAIELNPKYVNAYHNRGASKNLLNDTLGAILDFSKAIELNPNFSLSYYARGCTKSLLKDKFGAMADLTAAIKTDPKYAEAYAMRGSVKFAIFEFSGAIKDFATAIKLKPNYADAYYMRGLAESISGNKERACQDCRKAAALGLTKANVFIKEYCK